MVRPFHVPVCRHETLIIWTQTGLTAKERTAAMNHENFFVSERINEVTLMCERENPIYEQISSFSIALYVLGFFKCPDLMSFEDIDSREAAAYLKDDFTEIRQADLPSTYRITTSKDQYLLVIGDPSYPVHFAVLMDTKSRKPYFSKLNFFGSGFDSLEDLKREYLGKDGLNEDDLHFFKKNNPVTQPNLESGKIYITRTNGDYSAFKEINGYLVREAG
ncbi:MAG: hypothetical protein C4522_02125 [Desulfobacteraceae bacterium]|nr:MAG: hypothetical protein C4522_02125 [Desulfobacteraceae bacterium]